jgi:aspartate carbamoyltransferase catalytic subunit
MFNTYFVYIIEKHGPLLYNEKNSKELTVLKGRHVIEPGDLTNSEIDEICSLAEQIIVDPASFQDVCRGKILATLFFEPSTRTRLSFEAAMLHLGGTVEGFADASYTSSTKGETLADTIRVVSSYVDVIAMRSPKEGAALLASQFSPVPVINAGDGGHYHPTQTLTDLLTIRALRGSYEGQTIGFCGDLKFGRTVHSLAKAMCRFKNNKFVFISPDELTIPEYMTENILKPAGVEFVSASRLEDVIGDLDILYMTRVQKERFFNEQDYLRLKDSYILDKEKMKLAKKDMIVLHPLPRVNEISPEVDSDPRAAYFKQVKYGMYARMALISKVTGCL